MKFFGNFVATEDNKADLFRLQVRLSISGTTNSLVVRISQKVCTFSVIVNLWMTVIWFAYFWCMFLVQGNEMGAFNKSCQIFCVKPSLVSEF